MNKYIFALIVVVIIVGLGASMYLKPHDAGTLTVAENTPADTSSTPAALSENDYTPPKPAPSDPQGLNRYQNATYRFSLLYPDDLGVREYKESADSMSATFESPDGNKGFQIYITKYSGDQITPERFRLDQPSGVRNEPVDVVVDGARATMFFGRNNAMGDTREVWFIHEGFLYEVTTYKELDSWLAGVMQTWKFLP